MNPVSFLLLGYGHIGKRHAAIIDALDWKGSLEIVDPRQNPESRNQKPETRGETREAREEGINHLVSLDQILKTQNSKLKTQNSTPIAVLATPNNLHCSQAIQCLEAGMDVVIEKPMGLNAEECRNVIAKAEELNKKVFCIMQNRYSPPAAWLKELVSSGKLGKIYQVQVNCIWNRSEEYYNQSTWKGKLKEDGGTLFTQFSHFIDTLFWLFGKIEPVSAQFFNHNHPYLEFEDSGIILARGNNYELGTNNYKLGTSNYELRNNNELGTSNYELNQNNELGTSNYELNQNYELGTSNYELNQNYELGTSNYELNQNYELGTSNYELSKGQMTTKPESKDEAQQLKNEKTNSSEFIVHSFPIQFTYSTSAYNKNLESSITILAEKGTVKVGGQYMEKVLACEVEDYEMPELKPTPPPNNYGTYQGSAANHAHVYENIKEVLEGKAEIHCTAEEGLRVVEFIEKVYKWRTEFN